ncbi:MAG: hypothetical protein LBM94_01400 [Propionibacteriaceae bacterium]|jgi:hypothetical protein|nr:hypothetical protein [Propionibacteriaceae bacterium]
MGDVASAHCPPAPLDTPAIVTALGLKGAAVCAVAVPMFALISDGWRPAVAALGVSAALIACFSLQFAGFNAIRRPGKLGVILSASGYLVRLCGLGLLLWAQIRFEFVTPGVQTTWVFIAGIAVIVAWLGGVLISARRMAPWLELQDYEPRADWGELA